MSSVSWKERVGEAAVAEVEPGMVLGVGTGSTVAFFIEALARARIVLDAVLPSSLRTEEALRARGFRIASPGEVREIDLYVDGADEVDPDLRLIKGGGGALTREKVLATASRRFVCIVDGTKEVEVLGRFGLPLEVVPFAVPFVARRMRALGGEPEVREGHVTDNGGAILDVRGLTIADPEGLERVINDIPGVVTCGIFAARRPELLLVADARGVRRRARAAEGPGDA